MTLIVGKASRNPDCRSWIAADRLITRGDGWRGDTTKVRRLREGRAVAAFADDGSGMPWVWRFCHAIDDGVVDLSLPGLERAIMAATEKQESPTATEGLVLGPWGLCIVTPMDLIPLDFGVAVALGSGAPFAQHGLCDVEYLDDVDAVRTALDYLFVDVSMNCFYVGPDYDLVLL